MKYNFLYISIIIGNIIFVNIFIFAYQNMLAPIIRLANPAPNQFLEEFLWSHGMVPD